MSGKQLGFAGLGRMGGPLSRRLVEAGYAVTGFDVAGTAERLPAGATAAGSIAELARTVGTIFLSVCLWRVYQHQFTPKSHFGFEAAAWYWHFVDVVWLFLFICIYVWGSGSAPGIE